MKIIGEVEIRAGNKVLKKPLNSMTRAFAEMYSILINPSTVQNQAITLTTRNYQTASSALSYAIIGFDYDRANEGHDKDHMWNRGLHNSDTGENPMSDDFNWYENANLSSAWASGTKKQTVYKTIKNESGSVKILRRLFLAIKQDPTATLSAHLAYGCLVWCCEEIFFPVEDEESATISITLTLDVDQTTTDWVTDSSIGLMRGWFSNADTSIKNASNETKTGTITGGSYGHVANGCPSLKLGSSAAASNGYSITNDLTDYTQLGNLLITMDSYDAVNDTYNVRVQRFLQNNHSVSETIREIAIYSEVGIHYAYTNIMLFHKILDDAITFAAGEIIDVEIVIPFDMSHIASPAIDTAIASSDGNTITATFNKAIDDTETYTDSADGGVHGLPFSIEIESGSLVYPTTQTVTSDNIVLSGGFNINAGEDVQLSYRSNGHAKGGVRATDGTYLRDFKEYAGTCSSTSTIVTWVSGDYFAYSAIGDTITIDGETRTITNVISDMCLYINTALSKTAVAYTINDNRETVDVSAVT